MPWPRRLLILAGTLFASAASPGCAGPGAMTAEKISGLVVAVVHAERSNERAGRYAEDRLLGSHNNDFPSEDSIFHSWEKQFQALRNEIRPETSVAGLHSLLLQLDIRMDSTRRIHTYVHPLFGER